MHGMRAFIGLLLLAPFGAIAATNEVTFDGLGMSNPTPSFDNGYVVGWSQSGQESVTLYAPNGHKLFEISALKLPDGTDAGSLSAAVDTDGTLALAYWAQGGARGGIALLDQTGKPVRFIETQPFMPSQVCFAPDHSIWMFGDQQPRPATDFLTFRRYSREGRQLGAFILRSELPAWEGGGLDQVLAPFHGLWRLRAIQDRIGAILRVAPFKWAWVELDLDGKLIGQWTYTGSMAEWFVPAAFTSSGSLYGRRWVDKQRAGLGAFDMATGTWQTLSFSSEGNLIGAQGDRLVFQRGDQLRWIQESSARPIQHPSY